MSPPPTHPPAPPCPAMAKPTDPQAEQDGRKMFRDLLDNLDTTPADQRISYFQQQLDIIKQQTGFEYAGPFDGVDGSKTWVQRTQPWGAVTLTPEGGVYSGQFLNPNQYVHESNGSVQPKYTNLKPIIPNF